MASPDHKQGLAVVVPTSDIRSPTQRKSKQHALLNVPRNRLSQVNGNTPPRLMNVGIPPGEPIALSPPRQPNGAPFRRQSTGVASLPSANGTLRPQKRLLNVDQALQFSPFSSIVPSGPREFPSFLLELRYLTSSDIIPTPNANLPGPRHVFPTAKEHRIARQPLDYLSGELSRTQGKSSIAQRSKHDLLAFLGPDIVTDL